MAEKLENMFHRFKGRVNAIEEGVDRPGFKFIRMISNNKQKFIGWAKDIPDYFKVGVVTEIYYMADEDNEYQIMAYTVPK